MTMRCQWCTSDPIYMAYHDNEWGVPLKDEKKLFELLNLEGMQAGLSWITILKKREAYREAFDNFDPYKITNYDSDKIEKLMHNASIVRNKLKINSIVNNSNCYIKFKEQFPEDNSFSDYLWSFVNHQSIIGNEEKLTKNDNSDKMSQALMKKGFKFVGTTICYAFMQASGMIIDHDKSCYKNIKA
jgi:DNA-3-methyladenine glycosylase I